MAISDDPRLPDLRFVPTESLVPHEQHDGQRLGPLVERFREQAILRNPPVVTPLGIDGTAGGCYMVLDGANRSSAARAAGLPHFVVQVVRYDDPGVQLSTWCHAIESVPRAELEAELAKIAGLAIEPATLLRARALLARREALAYIHYADGGVDTLHGGRGLMEQNALLNAVVDVYRGRRFQRVTGDSLEQARVGHPEVLALVVFPHFEPAEILELATSGARLPAGISRHLIRWRALRVNVPMEWMSDTTVSLDEKNRRLAEWIQEKVSKRQVRLYEEPTVLFDE